MLQTAPLAHAPQSPLTGLTVTYEELRAQAHRLCQQSKEIRAQARAISQFATVLRQSALPRVFPVPWASTSSPAARPAIGGGAATEAVLRDYICATCLGPGDLALDDDEPLLANGILDSLGIMRLAVFIEETFRIAVPDDALVPENFGTVRRVAALVECLEAQPVRA